MTTVELEQMVKGFDAVLDLTEKFPDISIGTIMEELASFDKDFERGMLTAVKMLFGKK